MLPQTSSRRALAGVFARLLQYPVESPLEAAWEGVERLGDGQPDAAALVQAFAEVAGDTPLGELQEEYTRAFDLDTLSRLEPTCYLHVGHYLFEETHKRGAFILELRKRFRAQGFEDASDLPDHLVVLLRFLAVSDDEELAGELVEDALLPVLQRMALLAGSSGEPRPVRQAYFGVLRALELGLGGSADRAEPERALEREAEREWLRDRVSLGIDRAWC